MAFPSDTGTVQDSLAVAWQRARGLAAGIKARATSLRAASASGPIEAGSVLDFATALADAKLGLQRSASVQGIGAYGAIADFW